MCFSLTYQLLAYIGKHEGYPTYVAIKVSRNFDCDLLFFVLEKGGEALILDLLKTKWNGMIREPSLMSREIKPMDLMEVIKVCLFFFFSPLFFFPPLRFDHHTIVRRVSVSC